MSHESLSYSLSDSDISKILSSYGIDFQIITYPELSNYDSINELLDETPVCVILYLSSQNYGHWTVLLRLDNGEVEYFDSYGGFIDEPLELLENKLRISLKEDCPMLLELLYNFDGKVNYNNYRLQKLNKDIQTCGRHVCCRILFKDLFQDIDEYVFNMFYKDNINPDILVTLITDKFI